MKVLMRLKRVIPVIIILMCLLPFSTVAGSVAYITNVNAQADENGYVTISGYTSAGPGHEVTVSVMAPDGHMEYVDGITSGASGKFNFVNKLSGSKAGRYTVTIGTNGIQDIVKTFFNYLTARSDDEVTDVTVKASIDKYKKVTVTGTVSSGDGQQAAILIKDPDGKFEYIDAGTGKNGGKYELSYIMKNTRKGRYTVAASASGSVSPAFTFFDYGIDADLKTLYVEGGMLSPGFKSDTTVYSVIANKTVKSIRVAAAANDNSSVVRINGIRTAGGEPPAPIELVSGTNIIYVEVTAQDGITVKNYSIIVDKMTETNVTTTVKAGINNEKRVTIKGTVSSGDGRQIAVKITDPDNRVEYIGNTVSKNRGEYSLDYTMENNRTGKYHVTAGANGMSAAAATWFIYDPSNADLRSLAVLDAKIKPGFSPEVVKYSAEVPYDTDHVRIIPEANSEDQVIKINDNAVKSGEASDSLRLYQGRNAFRIKVTSPDGTNSKTYIVNINRMPPPLPPKRDLSSNADLSGLSIDGAVLTEPFSSSLVEYLTEIVAEGSVITVTPTVSDGRATVTVNGIPVNSGTASGPITVTGEYTNVYIAVTAEDGTTKEYIVTVITV